MGPHFRKMGGEPPKTARCRFGADLTKTAGIVIWTGVALLIRFWPFDHRGILDIWGTERPKRPKVTFLGQLFPRNPRHFAGGPNQTGSEISEESSTFGGHFFRTPDIEESSTLFHHLPLAIGGRKQKNRNGGPTTRARGRGDTDPANGWLYDSPLLPAGSCLEGVQKKGGIGGSSK